MTKKTLFDLEPWEFPRHGASLFVKVAIALSIPLMLYSRVPGSVGPGVWWPNIIFGGFGMLLVTVFAFGGSEVDVVPFWFTQVGFYLWLVHLFMYCRGHRLGCGVHSYHLGKSWLNVLRPSASNAGEVAREGDLLMGTILAGVSLYLGSPATAAWWGLNIVLCLFTSGVVSLRDAARQRQIKTALDEQEYWIKLMEAAHNPGQDLE
jgi:hypothetical protein